MLEFDGNRIFSKGNFASFTVKNTSTGKEVIRNYNTERLEFKSPCEHLLQSEGCDVEIQIVAAETDDSKKLNGQTQRPNLFFSYRFKSISK